MERPDVYLAAPLFSTAEMEFNARLTERLEALGLRVFLPQRDGRKVAADDGAAAETSRQAFDLDVRKIEASQFVVAVLDGRVPDDGVCVELGIAWQLSRTVGRPRLIVGLKSDVRTWVRGHALNPMIAGTLDHLFDREDALLGFLEDQAG